MLDDRRRAQRIKADRRTDVTVATRAHRFFEALQFRICRALEEMDGAGMFQTDPWERPGGGGGRSRVIENGTVFEKGGVNTSAVHGELPERMAGVLGVQQGRFFATGISLVIHPWSPFVPTVHANFRYFALGEDLFKPDDEWFGGGADLTPYYPFLNDIQHFHRTWKSVCDRHQIADYPAFKRACDDYFFLPHRGETRGVGGVFFDYLRSDVEETFHFIRDSGRAFLSSYLPIVERRRELPYTDDQRRYQEMRRGRYAEFNLVYDRGTKFGLETGGRTESILMSLPPKAAWQYNWQPESGSAEEKAARFFHPYDWLSIGEDVKEFALFEPGAYGF